MIHIIDIVTPTGNKNDTTGFESAQTIYNIFMITELDIPL